MLTVGGAITVAQDYQLIGVPAIGLGALMVLMFAGAAVRTADKKWKKAEDAIKTANEKGKESTAAVGALSNRIVSAAIESMVALQPIANFLENNASWDLHIRRTWESRLLDKLEKIYKSLASISEQAADRLGLPPKPLQPDEAPPSGAMLRSIVSEKMRKLETIERNPLGN